LWLSGETLFCPPKPKSQVITDSGSGEPFHKGIEILAPIIYRTDGSASSEAQLISVETQKGRNPLLRLSFADLSFHESQVTNRRGWLRLFFRKNRPT
jgi:hypothetical protein